MLDWLKRRSKKLDQTCYGPGKIIDTDYFREIATLQKKLFSKGKVPASPKEADLLWNDLSRLSELLITLTDLPATNAEKTEQLLAGKNTPPFANDARWHYYRWVRVQMAKQLHREKKYQTALGLWFEAAIIDYMQIGLVPANQNPIETMHLRGMQVCVKRGKINRSKAEPIFLDVIRSFNKARHQEIWNVIVKSGVFDCN